MHETSLGYNQGDSTSVAGVFSTIEDATNCIKRIVSEEYEGLVTEDEDTVEITERNGLLRWYNNDNGEGDMASLYVESICYERQAPKSRENGVRMQARVAGWRMEKKGRNGLKMYFAAVIRWYYL
ncbi:c3e7eecc-5ec9-41ca-870e-4a2da35b5b85-CDS [Sclerotinia trifoliorum]|uniref:C3e7eecc-5ec9-41ca-870e-4a2da35b5b85-CDS n=1 Tax=Sclerotinia trifoliorum TaxID=28548 RepID=A0A8H2ZQR6_9HELO|nr:c3e7eecc-5ec9-41ca-870e-4a2da35b5b85-CDS [Sclerotinia trifoliorum]